MSDENDKRTEAPTARRIREARESGRIARSRELVAISALLAALALLDGMAEDVLDGLASTWRELLEIGLEGPSDPRALATLASTMLSSGLSLLLPVALVAWAVALLTGLVQNVFLLRPANLIPSWSRLSPRRALARMTGARLFARVLLVLLELGVVAWVYGANASEAVAAVDELASSGDGGPIDPSAVARTVAERALDAAVSAASGLLLLAAGDWALERYFLLRDLRMTREEVAAEARESEPDAGLAAERRRRWRDLHGRRDEKEGER